MFERQQPSSTFYTPENKPSLLQRLDKLEEEVRAELKRQGFSGKRVRVERMLNMRFDGTDTSLMVLPAEEDSKENSEPEDFLTAFRKAYKNEFGFLLDTKHIIVDDIKVTVTWSASPPPPLSSLVSSFAVASYSFDLANLQRLHRFGGGGVNHA